ncbi:FAD binding domain-containing protein [Bradyrhizobium sp.]|jgi:carbon-monoxide dehydrogenase medium subunit|uniref:FAD binding domain-containing protein n=1 Tax=Bradyrhizobium sp. TaxID=376 RepID=UPI003C1EE577
MKEFSYYKPATVSEAVALLAASDESRLLSGGMTLLPTMKQRLASPKAIVDLAALPGLVGITIGGGNVALGAMTTHAEVANSASVKAALPALATLAGLIGDPQVRHRGTIGGSIANADPAADYPAAVLGLGATIVTDRREIAAESFFKAMFQTALERDEIILAVRFPIPDAAGYAKFKSQASRFALVGAFVARFGSAVRVAITGAGPVVFRSQDIEDALASNFSPQALARISIAPSGLNSDIHADSEYRAHLVVVMARRAVEQAMIEPS